MSLGHSVESATVLKPLDLGLVVGMRELGFPSLSILGVDPQSHGLAYRKLSAEEVDLVFWVDLVVVGWVGESQRKHALFLQVRLVLWDVSMNQIVLSQDLRYGQSFV